MVQYFSAMMFQAERLLFLQAKRSSCHRLRASYSSHYAYEMPERIRNSFYLANASHFDNANWFIQRAYEVVFGDLVEELKDREPNLSPDEAQSKVCDMIKVLEPCNVVLDVHYPVKRSNGNLSIVRAYRALHGKYKNRLPSLGGLRIGSKISKDEVKALAALSTYRYACLGIDMVGSCGGIKINPAEYARDELQVILENYALELSRRGLCGEFGDVIQPDFCTGSQEMTWIANAQIDVSDQDRPEKACSVGKQFEAGGLENYDKSGSRGVQFGLNYFFKHKNTLDEFGFQTGLENKTFILQGLGIVGRDIGTYLTNSGAKCIGVKEIDAYVYDSNGLDISEIIKHKNATGSIQNFNMRTKPYQNDSILTEECDILILAAAQKSLIYYVADKVKAKAIVEIVHGAITPSAYATLIGRNKLVLPDIYMSSGYSLVSHYEYLKSNLHLPHPLTRSLTRDVFRDLIYNVQGPVNTDKSRLQVQEKFDYFKEQKLLTEAMEYVMEQTTREVLKITEKYNLGFDIRTAAYVKAIKNIFTAIYDSKTYK